MAGMFDDLVPQKPGQPPGQPPGQKPGALNFDDLVQQGQPTSMLGNAYRKLSDFTNAGMDTFSHGFANKLLGGEQARLDTEAARNRLGWGALPADIAASVVAAPYEVASKMAGTLYGAGEGALDAYGHQKNWVPSLSDAGNIVMGAGRGAAGGFVGAGVGGKLGALYSRYKSKLAQTFPSDAHLERAAQKATEENPNSLLAMDRHSRLAQIQAARAANETGGRNAFADMLPGTKAEQEAAQAIANKKSFTTKMGEYAAPFAYTNPWLAATASTAATHQLLSGNPMIAAGLIAPGLAASAVKKLGETNWANRVPKGTLENYAALVRDPSGRGIRTDPEAVNAARDLLAKMGIGAGKSFSR